MRNIAIVAVLLFCVGGCAKSADSVTATYISPLAYQGLRCDQIHEEAARVSARVAEVTGVQNRKRTGDIVKTTAAVVLFWPAAFFISGDDEKTAELARLKGEMDALQQAATRKGCALKLEPVGPPPS